MSSCSVQISNTQPFIDLSAQHIRVLDWLSDYCAHTDSAVPQQALLSAFSDQAQIVDILNELERIGCIQCQQQQVLLVEKLVELPVIGQVAAGTPIEAIENHDMQLSLPLNLFRERPTYLLKVRGDSMQGIGIMDGDLIAVKKTHKARNGQVVVARVDDEVTVKRLNIDNQQVALMPENPDYEPILVSAESLVIEGEFVGLIRPNRTLH